jgi:hypothetical protein
LFGLIFPRDLPPRVLGFAHHRMRRIDFAKPLITGVKHQFRDSTGAKSAHSPNGVDLDQTVPRAPVIV